MEHLHIMKLLLMFSLVLGGESTVLCLHLFFASLYIYPLLLELQLCHALSVFCHLLSMRLASVSALALFSSANASCHICFPFCSTEVVQEERVNILDGGADVELDLADAEPKFLPFEVMSAA